jgi:hypothetical protein
VSDTLPGIIAIEVGTGVLTVSGALPTLPSLIALIVTDPFAIAVTSPFESTVASAGFELCQATTRPLRTFPCASLTVAVACVVCPLESVLLASATVTDAAGTSRTLMDAVAFLLFDWAVMMARPFATPVTSPASDTVAMAVFEDVHLVLVPVKVRPSASNAVAMSWTLSRGTMEAFCGVRLIEATLPRRTSTDADAVTPLISAVIVTDPSVSAFMTPSVPTVAIVGSELTH